jgi:oxidase EvaA
MSERDIGSLFCESWLGATAGINRLEDILAWVDERNRSTCVEIKKIPLADSGFWYYDEQTGRIVNRDHSFFQIAGARWWGRLGETVEQPIMLQDEIGYLSFLCKVFDGVLHFLAQAKIEPGNVNKVQISPTVQATKSNFTRRHGGGQPAYLEYFINAARYRIIADQLQSEQSSRFLSKRNRNIIVLLGDDDAVPELPTHKWLTLGQIKALMRIDNLVNMDTRTVLSCIPFFEYGGGLTAIAPAAKDTSLLRSLSAPSDPRVLPRIYQYINNYKMFDMKNVELSPLYSLKDWGMRGDAFAREGGYAFQVIFRDIAIEGREVRRWTQPLFEATGMAIFGLFTRVSSCVREFLVCPRPEIGCLDGMELGPTVQLEAGADPVGEDEVIRLFLARRQKGEGILYDVILSEEGGRFYHEQNVNAIIEIGEDELSEPPEGYFWLSLGLLNGLTQINNCLNIQLRNLLVLLEI